MRKFIKKILHLSCKRKLASSIAKFLFIFWIPAFAGMTILLYDAEAEPNNSFNYTDFAKIPILHEGRIKPLDSFARVSLKKIHGTVSLPNETAITWLASVMFTPADAMEQRIFTVNSSELITILHLPERQPLLFNFNEMAEVFSGKQMLIKTLLKKDKKTLTANEQELIRLYNNVNDFAEIMGTFSLLVPLQDITSEIRGKFDLPAGDITYLDLVKHREKINDALKKIIKIKHDKIDSYTPQEQEIAKLSYRINVINTIDKNNNLVRIIPPTWQQNEEWLAPWAVIIKGAGSPASKALFKEWQTLGIAYKNNDAPAWKAESSSILAANFKAEHVRSSAISLEVLYNAIDPLSKSLMGYALALGLALIALLLNSHKWSVASYGVIYISAAIHGLGILARMCILMRPPVSTLYESMIFVSFISAIFVLILERKRKNSDSLLISAAISSLLIISANVFAADSDTLEVLVAVLNTNFWLATHVVCITTGYATSLIAGAMGHLYLCKRAYGKTSVSTLTHMHNNLHKISLIALLFTAVGTMLGGIWADQSWGRFWGWDPKENGALWIVLWLIWLIHGRIAGQIRELGFAVGMSLITIVVALAWVGVNLLSVGLHSYGFTDIAANGLLFFCAVELAFVAIVTLIIRQRNALHAA